MLWLRNAYRWYRFGRDTKRRARALGARSVHLTGTIL